MITKQFTVHSAVEAPFQVDAIVAGEAMPAVVNGLSIELIAADGSGSQTIRLTGTSEELTAALADFAPGAAVTATYAPTAA